MREGIKALFYDKEIVKKVKLRLPKMFQLAELESSRAGKIGMEVGSIREAIIIALLIYKFGDKNIETNIPITESEVDFRAFGKPISIKTITTNTLTGVKIIWTVDYKKVEEFIKSYYPKVDMLLVQINWNKQGGLFYIPIDVQKRIFKKLGKDKYIKVPKKGTNPRGIEISKEALIDLINDRETKSINIEWIRSKIDFNLYKRWIKLWEQD